MDDTDLLTEQFEANRTHLRAVAYRMLGSAPDADDAVQEAWIRMNRAGTDDVTNLGGWMTTVVARVSLDMLRSRKARRESPTDEYDDNTAAATATDAQVVDPEQEAILADSVGIALLVVLDTLSPAERLAFVLHDLFAVRFDEIAPIVGRSPDATRQLASRARRRVQGTAPASPIEFARQRALVDAFQAATRGGDFDALLAVLDPDVVRRADDAVLPPGVPAVVRGAREVARSAVLASARAPHAAPMLVDGSLALVHAPAGRLTTVLVFSFGDERITQIDVIADPERLATLELAVLPD